MNKKIDKLNLINLILIGTLLTLIFLFSNDFAGILAFLKLVYGGRNILLGLIAGALTFTIIMLNIAVFILSIILLCKKHKSMYYINLTELIMSIIILVYFFNSFTM